MICLSMLYVSKEQGAPLVMVFISKQKIGKKTEKEKEELFTFLDYLHHRIWLMNVF